MDLSQLEVFVAVARERRFSRAARLSSALSGDKVDGTVFAVGIGSHGPASAGGRHIVRTRVQTRDSSR